MFETIDFSKSKQYTLSIRLSTDGFSFSIYNPTQEEPGSFYEKDIDVSLSLTANLKTCLGSLEFLAYPYKRIHIILPVKRFTLVPLEQFDDEQAELLFKYSHFEQPNETILYHTLKRLNTVVIWGMDKSAHQLLSEYFPQASFHCQHSLMLEYFQQKSRLGNSKKLYAYLRGEAIDLYGYAQGRLLLVNTFECTQTTDRIYYLLYAWKQLELDQQRDELHLSGMLNEKETLLAELRQYIQQVFIMNPETHIDISAILSCE